jgi:hypothetical protein
MRASNLQGYIDFAAVWDEAGERVEAERLAAEEAARAIEYEDEVGELDYTRAF